MNSNIKFTPGLELARRFYWEVVRPILDADFPDLRHSAALIGAGSEVLGFDTPMSSDHHWGPRAMLFLAEGNYERQRDRIIETFRWKLPHCFLGYPTNFSAPNPDDNGTQLLAATEAGPVNHRVEIYTIRGFFQGYLDFDIARVIEPADWLTFGEQALRTITAGAVFHDDLGLEAVRARFAHYPRDVWLYMLAAGWARIGQEEHLMGRAGLVGDEIGSALIGARLVRDVMRLCFLMERQYAPYPKWFGTAFQRLACAPELTYDLRRAQQAGMWQERESHLCAAYEVVAAMHNRLAITEPLPAQVRPFWGRPFRVIGGERFAAALRAQITDPAVTRIAERGLVGGSDQFSDSTDLLSDPNWRGMLRKLYICREDEHLSTVPTPTGGRLMQLFQQPLRPINLGLESFYDSMASQGAEPVAVDWRPPLDGYAELTHTRAGVDIDAANAEAVRRICAGRPMLIGMGIARDVIPGFAPSGKARLLITHSGPPITWSRMCGPTRGAIMGALIYEGLAETPEGAAALAASGEIEFAPCHHYHAVGPMAGIISPSMPVFIVKNEATGDLAYATQNEGLGKVLRYGAYGPEVIRRLKWMETTLYPALQAALAISGPIDLRSMIAQALHMGDECHNRNKAGTSLLIRTLAPALVEAVNDPAAVAAVLRFMDGNDHFFLNLSMPAMKAMLLPAEGIPGCTLVTTMARNGTDWGIRVSGTGDRWFTAPAPLVQGLWLPGFSAADANPDIGDSAITETGGIGGFALAGAPAIVKFVGGTPQDALNATLDMYEICAGEHTAFTIPPLNFRGTPVGIDVRKVMRAGITPWLNTGIAHREPGIGMVGAGLVQAPKGCFEAAFEVSKAL